MTVTKKAKKTAPLVIVTSTVVGAVAAPFIPFVTISIITGAAVGAALAVSYYAGKIVAHFEKK
ncbi:MAG: hypothetical protein Q8O88_02850 [bacterium]|nr:hypothetical protein [bacterium]